MEWDEFDFSTQPTSHALYGESEPRRVYGVEHYGTVEVRSPNGRTHRGRHHTEVFLNGRFSAVRFRGTEGERARAGGAGNSVAAARAASARARRFGPRGL